MAHCYRLLILWVLLLIIPSSDYLPDGDYPNALIDSLKQLSFNGKRLLSLIVLGDMV